MLFCMRCRMPPAPEPQRLLRLQSQRSAAARPLPPPPSRRASGPGCSWSRPPSGRSWTCDQCRRYLLPQRQLRRSWPMLSCSRTQCSRLSTRHSWSMASDGRLRTSRLRPQAWCHSRARATARRAMPWATAARCITTAARCRATVCSPRTTSTPAAACNIRTQHLRLHIFHQLAQTSCRTHRQVICLAWNSCSTVIACRTPGSCNNVLISLWRQASLATETALQQRSSTRAGSAVWGSFTYPSLATDQLAPGQQLAAQLAGNLRLPAPGAAAAMAGGGQRDGRAAEQNNSAAVPCPQRNSSAAPLAVQCAATRTPASTV